MADSSLQDRLRDHAKAFDGLLSLIPAKYYYGEDNSDQWKKKKQTKEEAAAARRAKLDPDSAKSAKDVMDERAKKRKLEQLEEEGSDIEGVEKELPRQGLKQADAKNKKQKVQDKEDKKPNGTAKAPADDAEAAKQARIEAKKAKVALKKEKATKKAEKQKAKKAKVAEQKVDLRDDDAEIDVEGIVAEDEVADETVEGDETTTGGDEMQDIEMDGIADEVDAEKETSPQPTVSSTSTPQSPTFDTTDKPSTNSTSTSTSSVVPPTKAPKHIKLPTDPDLLKARLAARIEALRAARKADGPNGAPARNRQELMESRRKKEEQRRAHKKELRNQARAEEDARREEALASVRDSPASGIMSPAIHTAEVNNFSFGRVAFADGQQLTDDLSTLMSAPKKRGPQDPATALQAAENKRLRLAGLDDGKRADIEEKDMWLAAKRHAHGEKVRDDGSLLKKTLKRREKAKKKSEKEWGERKEGVAKSQAIRQKKREENLQKRKDSKGVKGKKGGKPGAKKGGAKPKSRPGFEGSFTTKKR
ncbi:hypothetical protein V499_05969 [Pseudogymnoascus sp. VKM F-103]|uniref:Ribosomal RNA-processing protein 14/surfeit locus protein 6 C-terminal domain-containing protein n=1 Tax=Pseudogymnoascus verrucosus TaxID=342668 RepID=A0A1B8GBW8_9PEZI|nr:uncharacterized protein VE01_08464 [Pseudogymnoascus verrucosus]KFY73957.1 hypothetical protein V499_05969 [Pseudogymnoascus sp. VKM F-103]OBT93349.1 hypothetical protein VE01_08464 [Pseudogymnoascus verrucosus]